MGSKDLLKSVKKVRLSDAVIDQIVSLIEEGKLKINDQLPGERELVEQLQVGRASVREALRVLEAQGIIEVHQGKGTFIKAYPIDVENDALHIEMWFKRHAQEYFDMIDVRNGLEVLAARRAAAHVTEDELDEIQATIDEAMHAVEAGDLENLSAIDQQFHLLVAKASRNPLLLDLIVAAVDALASRRQSMLILPGRAEVSFQQHSNILEAIRSGDPDGAEVAMQAHIDSIRETLLTLKNEGDE